MERSASELSRKSKRMHNKGTYYTVSHGSEVYMCDNPILRA